MTISLMPEVLRWDGGEAVCEEVHAAYLDLLAQKMGEALGESCRAEPAAAEGLRAAAGSVSDEGFVRVLTAPETCSRLLGGRAGTPAERGQFFRRSFLAEALREGQAGPFDEEVWTALGDACFAPGGGGRGWPQVEGMPPLDYGSPYAARVDLSGADRESVPARTPFNDDELRLVAARLGDVRERVRRTSPRVAHFVAEFNKVLVLQKDDESPQQFASGSNGHYIGRSFLANPHLPQVCEVHVADAVVHEGIHALLYMQEQADPWLSDPALKRSPPRVRSPWSGSSLTLPSFLQACFVWYGLLHFWSLALSAATFDRGLALQRISLSARGFLGARLREKVSAYLPAVNGRVVGAVDEMQDVVSAAFSSAAASV